MPKYQKKNVPRQRRKPYSKRRTSSFRQIAKIAKSVVMRTAETKYRVQHAENQNIYHNGGLAGGIMLIQNMLSTTQGVNEEQRIGDKIQAKGLSIKLHLFNKSDRPNVMYRIMVVAVPPDQSGQALPAGFWENDIGNKILDHVNTNRYKVIRSKIVQIQGQDTAFEAGVDTLREKSKLVSMYIPLKGRTITYSTEAGGVPKLQRDCLSLAILPYDAYGSLTTDNIASFAYVTRFYFKDI